MAEQQSPENLTGIWHGQYNYPIARPPVAFVATLVDRGGVLTGAVTETCELPRRLGEILNAAVSGQRDGRAVRFTKTYEGQDPAYPAVIYDGGLSEDCTEIEGTWRNAGWSGRFLMIRSGGKMAEIRRDVPATV